MSDKVGEAGSPTRRGPGGQTSLFQELAKLDRGRLAALRRNAGSRLADARGVPWFYLYLNRYLSHYGRSGGGARDDDEEILFLAATLFAIYPSAPGPERGSFGATFRRLSAMREGKEFPLMGARVGPTERRFAELLDAEWGGADPLRADDLRWRLRQAVRILRAARIAPDWPRLLRDLRGWNLEDRPVQKRWARDFYAVQSESEPVDSDDVHDEEGQTLAAREESQC